MNWHLPRIMITIVGCCFILFSVFGNPMTVNAQNVTPNTGDIQEKYGAKPFYSRMVDLGWFDDREPQDLLDVWNGQYQLQVFDVWGQQTINPKPVNGTYSSTEPTGDDAEWQIGAFTVANKNNSDSDSSYWLWPLSDNSVEELGVRAEDGFGGRDEVDLVKLVIRCPDGFLPYYSEAHLAVSGPVRFYEDSRKVTPHPWLQPFGWVDGISIWRVDSFELFLEQEIEIWVEVVEQTPMNGVQIAFFRDDVPWPGRENLIHEYDRCTITGIWAEGFGRTTQGVAKFERVSSLRLNKVTVKDADSQFVAEIQKAGNIPVVLRRAKFLQQASNQIAKGDKCPPVVGR